MLGQRRSGDLLRELQNELIDRRSWGSTAPRPRRMFECMRSSLAGDDTALGYHTPAKYESHNTHHH